MVCPVSSKIKLIIGSRDTKLAKTTSTIKKVIICSPAT